MKKLIEDTQSLVAELNEGYQELLRLKQEERELLEQLKVELDRMLEKDSLSNG